jgi:hypothetical protein
MNKLYTQAELNTLKETIEGITTFIPENIAPYVWENYQKIADTTEGKPCMCGSAAGLWRKAVTVINDYLKTNPEPIDDSGSEQ